MTATDLIETLKAVNIKAIARTALQKNADTYTEANRDQMMEGKRKDERNIGDSPGNYYASLMYARDKQKKNSKAGFMNPDLRLTGSFQDSMYMNVKGDDIMMDSTDYKTKDLVKKYGDTIFGLNEKTKEPFLEVLKPDFQELFTKETGLKFN